MRRTTAGYVGCLVFFVEAVGATPPALTIAQLADVCASATIAEAAAKGDRLGWEHADSARLKEWRDAFIALSNSSVQVIGWRRGEQEEEILSFWIAQGSNGHKACAYSVSNSAGLLEALSGHFGSPGSLDKYDFGAGAFWQSGSTEIQLTQVGSHAVVNISRPD